MHQLIQALNAGFATIAAGQRKTREQMRKLMNDFTRFNQSLAGLKASVDANTAVVDKLIGKIGTGGNDQPLIDSAADQLDAAKAVVDATNAKGDAA